MSSTKQVTTSTLISSGYKSPVGRLTLVASAQGLRAILWPNDDPRRVPGVADAKKGSNPIIESTTHQLDEYFAGTRHEFDVPLDAVGTEFQHSVWQVLRSISYG
ncbi:MAG: cysteine methyltransferase, partial [Ilumatobacteraceae bacterium]|nr:cysteine methyltransferase [Ilumatobacteraceae bacterium]